MKRKSIDMSAQQKKRKAHMSPDKVIYRWVIHKDFLAKLDRAAEVQGFSSGITNRAAFLESLLEPLLDEVLESERDKPGIMDKIHQAALVEEPILGIPGNKSTKLLNSKIVVVLYCSGKNEHFRNITNSFGRRKRSCEAKNDQ